MKTADRITRLARALAGALSLAMAGLGGAASLADERDDAPPAGGGMTGAYGTYPLTREASGTSWQPDDSLHAGLHAMTDEWMLMGHARLNGVYDWQQGPRGDEKAFVSGMLMGSARRGLGEGNTLQLRAMLSPDPLMGKSGLPLLLGSGETADGRTPLVDRQHPHDLVMELSVSDAQQLGARDAVFVYAGLPGEPAFGPPAFMHRLSIEDSPEPPISHHWLDSTHITYGVVTAGWVHADWKLEASRFRGREPDQFRYNLESGRLDSTAARLSWNPAPAWSLQVSWAGVTSPEQLAPDENQRKWSASAIYTRPLGAAGYWSTTVALGRRSAEHGWLDAYVLESALHPDPRWTVFARAERVANNELLTTPGESHGPAYTVGKVSLGAVRDFPITEHVALGLGALYALNRLPAPLAASYGGTTPAGAMVFVRLKVE
ncbi:MAG: hypothetical protein JSR73_15075 [Proteobacteria bacterium]|nr:hypothetical protein [Pseudomonadota bacterium]